MIEQILDYIHNYFEVNVISGTFSISSGTLEVDGIQTNQYFRVVGSVFNDGVYKYPATGMTDETFDGEVWAMAVPPTVIALSSEIEQWCDKYDTVIQSPYQSESFGGYSYTKASGGSGEQTGPADWRTVFRSRLNRWRKIA